MPSPRILSAAIAGLVFAAATAGADSVTATRTLRAGELITAADVTLKAADVPGALQSLAAAIGKEARVSLYAGRPVRAGDVAAPAIVERNQIVPLKYHFAGLAIMTNGRALGRGGPGDTIRVMNMSSRNTVAGTVMVDGSVSVASRRP